MLFPAPATSAQVTLTIEGTAGGPEITSQPVTTAEQGQPYSYAVEAGGADLSYSLLEAPAGMSIDANGLITWTPTQLPGSYPVTVEVANAAGSTTQQFSIELAIARNLAAVSPVLECAVCLTASATVPRPGR